MDAIAASEPTRKQTAVFVWVTALAGLAALAVWLFVPDRFVKLAAIGSAGATFSLPCPGRSDRTSSLVSRRRRMISPPTRNEN
jgi:hypothetical protein